MSIPAIRNKFLTQETHVGVIDLSAPLPSDPYNLPGTDALEIDLDLGEFTSPLSQTLPKVKTDFIDETKRVSASGMSSIRDLSKLKDKDIQNEIGGFFPDNAAGNIMKGLSKDCMSKGMNTFDLGRPYSPSVNCHGQPSFGRSGGCSNGSFTDMLNKLTGGEYGGKFSDINNILKGIVGLTKLGYDMSMCGVFTALANKYGGALSKDMMGKAGASLLGFASASGNMKAVFDLSKSTVGPVAAIAGSLNKQGVKNIMGIKTLPTGVVEKGLGNHADAVKESAWAFNNKWDVSPVDNIQSARQLDPSNHLSTKMFSAKALSKPVSSDNMDATPPGYFDMMAIAGKSLNQGAGKLKLFGNFG